MLRWYLIHTKPLSERLVSPGPKVWPKVTP